MPRESARDKATRLLSEGRVIVTRADRDYIEAKIRGEGAIHSTGFLAGRWWCSCPSVGENCSHIWSLKRISAPDLAPSPTLQRNETDARISRGSWDAGGFE
jgi:hypothetical protein